MCMYMCVCVYIFLGMYVYVCVCIFLGKVMYVCVCVCVYALCLGTYGISS